MLLFIARAAFATDPNVEGEVFDINSIVYIEDDIQIDLGFDHFDYLPEGFDPYKMYVDLNAIAFIEEEPSLKVNSKKHLPEDFDAYAYPKDVKGFNYIDGNDQIDLEFDTQEHLPEDFDPYIVK
ncbi:MAG: hypothetical protein WBN18_08915 [Flavobacteriaceae bacterium]